MSDLAMGGGRAMVRYLVTDDEWGNPGTGRHALNEDAVLTPIFHALTRGGWRSRQHEPAVPRLNRSSARGRDPWDEFRHDPPTAPLPVLSPERPDQTEQGRHRLRRREPVGIGS